MRKLLLLSILITGLSIHFSGNERNSFFVSKAEAYGSSLSGGAANYAREKEKQEREIASKRLRMLSKIRAYESKNYEVIFFTPNQKDLPTHQEIANKCKGMDSIIYLDAEWREVDPNITPYFRILCQKPE